VPKYSGSPSSLNHWITEGPGENQLTVRLRDISGAYVPFSPGSYEIKSIENTSARKIESVRHPAFNTTDLLSAIKVRPFTYTFGVTDNDCSALGFLPVFDLNGDGRIDFGDVSEWMNAPYALNHDGASDDEDMKRLMIAVERFS